MAKNIRWRVQYRRIQREPSRSDTDVDDVEEDVDYYGEHHWAERAKYASTIKIHGGVCMERVCVMPTRRIEPGAKWHLAHDTAAGRHDRYLGPAHPECNMAEAIARGVTWEGMEDAGITPDMLELVRTKASTEGPETPDRLHALEESSPETLVLEGPLWDDPGGPVDDVEFRDRDWWLETWDNDPPTFILVCNPCAGDSCWFSRAHTAKDARREVCEKCRQSDLHVTWLDTRPDSEEWREHLRQHLEAQRGTVSEDEHDDRPDPGATHEWVSQFPLAQDPKYRSPLLVPIDRPSADELVGYLTARDPEHRFTGPRQVMEAALELGRRCGAIYTREDAYNIASLLLADHEHAPRIRPPFAENQPMHSALPTGTWRSEIYESEYLFLAYNNNVEHVIRYRVSEGPYAGWGCHETFKVGRDPVYAEGHEGNSLFLDSFTPDVTKEQGEEHRKRLTDLGLIADQPIANLVGTRVTFSTKHERSLHPMAVVLSAKVCAPDPDDSSLDATRSCRGDLEWDGTGERPPS